MPPLRDTSYVVVGMAEACPLLAKAIERGNHHGSESGQLVDMQRDFTHIHLAAEVAQRTIELCKARCKQAVEK